MNCRTDFSIKSSDCILNRRTRANGQPTEAADELQERSAHTSKTVLGLTPVALLKENFPF